MHSIPPKPSRLFPESALVEVLVSQRFGRQFEDYTSVRAYNGLAVLAVPTEILKVSAAADGFHERIEHHHGLGTDAAAVLIDRAAIGTFVLVPYLLSVSAVSFGMVTAKKSGDLNLEFILLVIPLLHCNPPVSQLAADNLAAGGLG